MTFLEEYKHINTKGTDLYVNLKPAITIEQASDMLKDVVIEPRWKRQVMIDASNMKLSTVFVNVILASISMLLLATMSLIIASNLSFVSEHKRSLGSLKSIGFTGRGLYLIMFY